MQKHSFRICAAIALSFAATGAPSFAQETENKDLSYSNIADTVSQAPIIAVATIIKDKFLRGELAINVPAGLHRHLVTSQVNALIRGDQGLPAKITYLIDVPISATNREPKLRKAKVLIAATPVAGKPDVIRLVGAGQVMWNPAVEAGYRGVIKEILSPDAPPAIKSVGNAFHVKGSLPGESETQIFLKTVDDSPVSLSILRRPGEDVRWAVALGEMVDDSATPPARNTLLWYRLACFLPGALPAASIDSLSADDALAANDDYRFVITALGSCGRSQPIR